MEELYIFVKEDWALEGNEWGVLYNDDHSIKKTWDSLHSNFSNLLMRG